MKAKAFLIASILFCAASLLLLYSHVQACSVPVFRYALTYWFADPYEVIVFHRGVLSPEEQAIVDRLQQAAQYGDLRANVAVKTVDLAGSPGVIMQKLWEAQSGSELPWMLVKYPRFSAVSDDVWAGRLTVDAVETLLDSPVRKKLARRLLDGEAAVWVLLESGVQKQDDAAASLLESHLSKISSSLKIMLPVWNEGQIDAVDTRISFSMVRLSRTDPAERMFVQMLLNSEWDLKTLPLPMAFPVFGRGRALYALVGDGIEEGNIEMGCSFLAGWCSCQVKADNPGVDLLMSVNWDEMISEGLYEETRLLLASSDSTATDGENTNTVKRNVLIAVSAQILIVAVVVGLVLWRKKQRRSAQ